jgi:hypothetical protein
MNSSSSTVVASSFGVLDGHNVDASVVKYFQVGRPFAYCKIKLFIWSCGHLLEIYEKVV